MSRNIDDKMREHALRIMEALSGVDEELLERCSRTGSYGAGQETGAEYEERSTQEAGNRLSRAEDEPGTGHGKGSGQRAGSPQEGGRKRRSRSLGRRPVWRFLGTWAAALLFAAVGIAGWQGYQLFGRVGSDSGLGGSTMQDNGTEYMWTGMGGPQEGQKSEVEGGISEEVPEAGAADGTEQEGHKAYGYEGADEEVAAPKDGDVTKDECWETDGLQEPESVNAALESDEEKCREMNARVYTEQEARSLEGLGIYVPDTLPEGYGFHRAYTNLDLERENLTVCWSRGTDYILLHLEVTEGAAETVETEKPETYDQRLYKVPYGETVPEEYRQVFMDPLFALDDLTLEIIESRMTVYEDAGDTDTPRGGFRVLYPEGVVVSFRGCGTAEEIQEMFCSMGE